MTDSTSPSRFICSYCEQAFDVTASHIGRCIRCPKCKKHVWVFPNSRTSIDSQLATTWRYKKLKLLGHQIVGPISGEEMLALYKARKLPEDMDVCCPQLTDSRWIELNQVDIGMLEARIAQRRAESQRLAANEQKRREIQRKNREIIQRAISAAVADGRVTLKERAQLFAFAQQANIPADEIEELLQSESESLLQTAIGEAIEDGILEPQERQRIADLAIGLGLDLKFTPEQERELRLCDLAYQLTAGKFTPNCKVDRNLQLGAREVPLCKAPFEWHEIVQTARPTGIPLGGGHFLKPVSRGDCVLTDKRIILVGTHTAKKLSLSSVANITRCADGLFFNRTSGKSVFLAPLESSFDVDQWAMLAVHYVTGGPVLGTTPHQRFIPEVDASPFERGHAAPQSFIAYEPRFTFRVVGDHIGDRRYWIEELELATPVRLEREPRNPYDSNAIAVFDPKLRQLGYLKREVAAWFAPMLDGGRRFRCNAYRKPESGGLITGVFDVD